MTTLSRRTFSKRLALGATGLAISANAKSYAQIVGANDRVNFAILGLHSRGYAHLSALAANAKTSRVAYACDVESNFLGKFLGKSQHELGYTPKPERDFRRLLESKDVDAISIATPDHWHAPMGIMAMQAGKHAYVEKPCSFNPDEGERLIAARDRYGKLIQIGNQQRSSAHTIEIIGKIHAGLLGRAYMASAWYVNNRVSIGFGKPAPVPATLDWDLFQGPAPRTEYHDNYQPYDWHWFKRWGTGESLNNGTHEMDIARWALQVDYPTSIGATGGRYAFNDDWQFYDTLSVECRYGAQTSPSDGKLITWEGLSCSPMRRYDRERGVLIRGTKGSVVLDRDGYELYDAAGKKTESFDANKQRTLSSDTTGIDAITPLHFGNLIAGIQRGEALRSPVDIGNVSSTMMHVANYSWATGDILQLNPATGRIVGNMAAEKMTRREYEKGWEPKV